MIPKTFVGLSETLKIKTAKTTVKTCLTFAAKVEQCQLTIGMQRGGKRRLEGKVSPATVIVKAEVFLFAVKLTTFNPKAMALLTASAVAFDLVMCVALYCLTRSSSPEAQPKRTH